MADIPSINPNKKINTAFRYVEKSRTKRIIIECGKLLTYIPDTPEDCVTIASLTIADEMRIIEVLQSTELALNTIMLRNSSDSNISIAIASIKPIIAPESDTNFILNAGQHVELSYILIEGYLYVLSSKIF